MADFLTDSVKTAYDDFYTNDQSEWCMLGAKYKVQNIVDVCKTLKSVRGLEVGADDGSFLHFPDQQQFAPEFYALEITKLNDFVIRKIPKTVIKNLKTDLIYRTKKALSKKKKEQLANAYTVLVKKSDQNIQFF